MLRMSTRSGQDRRQKPDALREYLHCEVWYADPTARLQLRLGSDVRDTLSFLYWALLGRRH